MTILNTWPGNTLDAEPQPGYEHDEGCPRGKMERALAAYDTSTHPAPSSSQGGE